jgi:hypothetical protein
MDFINKRAPNQINKSDNDWAYKNKLLQLTFMKLMMRCLAFSYQT